MVRLAQSAHDRVSMAMTAWIGWKTSRGRSRLGRSCSVGLSEGLTPARSRNVGFAGSGDCSVVAIAVDVSAAAEISEIEVVSDIAGTAWTDNPLYQGQPQGATAAGTSSLYYLLAGGEETCF